MAEQGAADVASAEGADYTNRESTYRRFLTIIRYALAVVVITLVLMAVFLT